jgi:predicted O-methyltransferase YrrM
MTLTTPPPPDVTYTERTHVPLVARPSWSANPGYLSDGHRTVYDETKDVPGWQMEGDAYKLYELAWFAGDVILDLGAFGGRSAVVEVKGALGRAGRAVAPQVYSLDTDPNAIPRSLHTLQSFGLERHVLLFQGTVDAFFGVHDVGPSMVFVDADHEYEGVRKDLETLTRVLAPGVPVLCHDYVNRENDTGEIGVRRAVQEWEDSGVARFIGTFGAAALLVTTEKCRGTVRRLPDDVFARRRAEALVTGGPDAAALHVAAPPPPDVAYEPRLVAQAVASPSWSGHDGYVDAGHRTVFAETKDIPGWQLEGDTCKLYEMAHFAGDVILDVGTFGGRSAAVELKGALARPGARPPQLFTLDLDHAAGPRSHGHLRALGLDAHALFYEGGLASFFESFPVGPTMVFLDADHEYAGVRNDMDVLSRYLAPGVPVLCHDYTNPENETGEYGVRQAAREWEEAGYVRFMGVFGCSVFFVTTERCTGTFRRLSDAEFQRRRQACHAAYGIEPTAAAVFSSSGAAEHPAVARVRELERELAHLRSTRAYRFARRLNAIVAPLLPKR